MDLPVAAHRRAPASPGILSFYNEKVDIYLDGVLQARPHTPFS